MCNCEASKPEAVCAGCGASGEAESFLELYVMLHSLGWGETACGALLCPECVERVANRVLMRANAHLN